MPDRFTRVITRFRRFFANRTTLLEPFFSPSYFHYSYSRCHFAPPPQTSSREVCPSFSSHPHPTSVRFDTFQITRSIVVARYSSKVTSIDKHQFSWYRGKWTPSFGFGSTSACREWSRSSCAMVDRVVDASNTIYFPRRNGMEIEMRRWTYFSIYLDYYYYMKDIRYKSFFWLKYLISKSIIHRCIDWFFKFFRINLSSPLIYSFIVCHLCLFASSIHFIITNY